MTSHLPFVCYNTHDKRHVTITAVGEDFCHKPLLHGLGKSPLLVTGVEEKLRVSTKLSVTSLAQQLLCHAQVLSH